MSKQELEVAYMPLFYNLHVTFAPFTSQNKFNVTPGTLGSLELVKNHLYSFWCMHHHHQSANMHITEIGSLCAMIYKEKDDNFICPSQAAVMMATKMYFLQETEQN